MAGSVVLAQPAHDFEAVDAWQHDVEHDQVGRALDAEREGLGAVARRLGLIAGAFEITRQNLSDGRLVVDDEDPRATARRGLWIGEARHLRRDHCPR